MRFPLRSLGWLLLAVPAFGATPCSGAAPDSPSGATRAAVDAGRITPGVGVGRVVLGRPRQWVLSVLGKPLRTARRPGGYLSETWASGGKPSGAARGADAETRQRIDRWIRDNGRNQYGDDPGTVYAGGTPLFSEATGETMDRYEYILKKHPDLEKQPDLAGGGDTLTVLFRADRVEQVEVTSPASRTADGLSTASTFKQIRARYPRLRVSERAAGGAVGYYGEARAAGITFYTEAQDDLMPEFRPLSIIVHRAGRAVVPRPAVPHPRG